jgi:hypothetical protein
MFYEQTGNLSETRSLPLLDPLAPGKNASDDVGGNTVPVTSAVGAAPGRIEELPTPSELPSVSSDVAIALG